MTQINLRLFTVRARSSWLAAVKEILTCFRKCALAHFTIVTIRKALEEMELTIRLISISFKLQQDFRHSLNAYLGRFIFVFFCVPTMKCCKLFNAVKVQLKNTVYTFDWGGLIVTIENCNPALVTASSMLATQVCAYLLSQQCCTVFTSNSTKTWLHRILLQPSSG